MKLFGCVDYGWIWNSEDGVVERVYFMECVNSGVDSSDGGGGSREVYNSGDGWLY